MARSIWLARLLPVEVFGAYALASSIVALTIIFPRFGLAEAFFHRSRETADENQASQVYLTLKLILGILWAVLVICGLIMMIWPPIHAFAFIANLAPSRAFHEWFMLFSILAWVYPTFYILRKLAKKEIASR